MAYHVMLTGYGHQLLEEALEEFYFTGDERDAAFEFFSSLLDTVEKIENDHNAWIIDVEEDEA